MFRINFNKRARHAVPTPPLPFMTSREIDLFSHILKKAKNFLEFGSGRSTIFIAQNYNINLHMSIETDKNFIDKLLLSPACINKVESGKLIFIHANIGKIEKAGYPADNNVDNYKNLLEYTLNLWNSIPGIFDLCLIDGRFRLCTALLALIKLKNCIYVFHDFKKRTYYHPLLEFIDIIDSADSLIVYKKKTSIDYTKVFNLINLYLFDAR